MKGKEFILNEKYIFAFVGDGLVRCFETKYTEAKGKMYGYFDCSLEVRLEATVDTSYIHYFNITNPKVSDYINCELYVFSSKENLQKLLPGIVKSSLNSMRKKAESLLAEYMKLVDDCNSTETAMNSIQEKSFEIEKTIL